MVVAREVTTQLFELTRLRWNQQLEEETDWVCPVTSRREAEDAHADVGFCPDPLPGCSGQVLSRRSDKGLDLVGETILVLKFELLLTAPLDRDRERDS